MPIAPTNGGRISGAKMSVESSGLPGNVVRAESMANGSAMHTAMEVVPHAMRNALSNPSRNTGSRNTLTT